MLIEIPNCPPGQCSQIAKAAAKLELKHLDLNAWIISNVINHLEEFSSPEFYNLIDGARNLLKQCELKKILKSYSDVVISQNKQNTFQDLRPQGVACLLKACADAEFKGDLSEVLLQQVFKTKSDYKLQEKVDLIAGLSLFNPNKQVLELLNEIELELAQIDLTRESLSVALTHFSRCYFIPFNLFDKVKNTLEDPNTPIWERISFLRSLALLGLKNEFSGYFSALMSSVEQITDGEKAFTKLYLNDLVQLIYIGAVFFEGTETPAVIHEIVEFLNSKPLSEQNRIDLISPLRAFGFFELAQQMSQGIKDALRSSYHQIVVSKAAEDYLKNHLKLIQLKFQIEGDVQGLKVDILINGFDELGIEQKPIVIEIDGVHHYAWNKPHHLLGKHYLRSKALKLAGCEFAAFDLRNRSEVVTKKICAYLRNKNAKWKQKNYGLDSKNL